MEMKKVFLAVFVLALGLAIACGTTPVKPVDVGDPKMAMVSAQNKQLAKLPVEGFEYKSAQVPAQKWDMWAKAAAPVVKEVITNLPEGYVLQVTGHTDGRGPEQPAGAKPGNIKISRDRAKGVHDSLGRAGITSPKMTYKGVGFSEPLAGIDADDPQQRRVTFKVVPK